MWLFGCASLAGSRHMSFLPWPFPSRLALRASDETSNAEQEATHAINQRIFETSLDLILVVDRRGSFIRVSPSSMMILGYRPDEMVGHSGAEFLYHEDLDSTRTEMRAARRGRLTRSFECRYVHTEGRVGAWG